MHYLYTGEWLLPMPVAVVLFADKRADKQPLSRMAGIGNYINGTTEQNNNSSNNSAAAADYINGHIEASTEGQERKRELIAEHCC